MNTNKLSPAVLTELKKYHNFFVHFSQAEQSFFFDEKIVWQILNTRKLQTYPGEIDINRAGSLQARLFDLIHDIAANKGGHVPIISSNLNYQEVVSPSIRPRP